MDPNRHPAGTPTGGRFAPDPHAEDPDVNVTDGDTSALWGLRGDTYADQVEAEAAIYGGHRVDRGVDLHDDDAPWTWTTLGEVTSEAHAADLFDRFDGSLGTAAAHLDAEWAAVRVGGRAARDRMRQGDLKPSDATSPDRNLRMHFASARGDAAFEGELLSDTFTLERHADSVAEDPGGSLRHIAAPPTVDGRRWSELSAEEGYAYLDGYGAGIDAGVTARSRDHAVEGPAVDPDETAALDRGPRLLHLDAEGSTDALRWNPRVAACREAGFRAARRVDAFVKVATDRRVEAATVARGQGQAAIRVIDVAVDRGARYRGHDTRGRLTTFAADDVIAFEAEGHRVDPPG